MAEPTPDLVGDRPADQAYRPVSGLALAGFALGCLYAGLVCLVTAIALIQGMPFFLPGWMILVAVAGLVLSLWGQAQIRNSEGTRAGMPLARWGFWISLFSGVGYLAYTTFTGLALTQQAHAFLVEEQGDEAGFFPHLQKGGRDSNVAYLLTLPPNARSGNPANELEMSRIHDVAALEAKGRLSRFREHVLVRATGRGKDQVKVEPLGVQGWTFENRGYQVLRNYRVTTPELVIDLLLPVKSSEGFAEGERRKWFVALPEAQVSSVKRTPLGEKLLLLRASAYRFVADWLSELNKGQPFDGFGKLDQTNWDRIVAKELLREQVKSQLAELFAGRSKDRLTLSLTAADALSPWEKLADGLLRLAVEFDHSLPGRGTVLPPYNLAGRFWLETQAPLDLETLPAPPQWNLVGIEITQVVFTPEKS